MNLLASIDHAISICSYCGQPATDAMDFKRLGYPVAFYLWFLPANFRDFYEIHTMDFRAVCEFHRKELLETQIIIQSSLLLFDSRRFLTQ